MARLMSMFVAAIVTACGQSDWAESTDGAGDDAGNAGGDAAPGDAAPGDDAEDAGETMPPDVGDGGTDGADGADGEPDVPVIDPDACLPYPHLSARCAPHLAADGATVCACPVSSGPAALQCPAVDPRAALAVQYRLRDASPPAWRVGTYPDLRGLTDEEVASRTVAGLFVAGTGAIHELLTDIPAGDGGGSSCTPGYRVVVPAVSPDARMILITTRYDACDRSERLSATIVRCSDVPGEGWTVRDILDTITSPFNRWGSSTGPDRTIYFAAQGLWVLTIAEDAEEVLAADGSLVRAVVLRGVRTLYRSPPGAMAAGDHDAAFDRRSGAWSDAYEVFISSDTDLVDEPCTWPRIRSTVLVSDIRDCDSDCVDDAGIDLPFCCRTAMVETGCCGLSGGFCPTDPAVSLDGRLLTFYRHSSDLAHLLRATLYVTHNPFEEPGLRARRCIEDTGRDGFHRPIDCHAELMAADVYDFEEGGFCPAYDRCTLPDVDCSLCISIGHQDIPRNEAGFFEWPPVGTGPRTQHFFTIRGEGAPCGAGTRQFLDVWEIRVAPAAPGAEAGEIILDDAASVPFVDGTGTDVCAIGSTTFRRPHAGSF